MYISRTHVQTWLRLKKFTNCMSAVIPEMQSLTEKLFLTQQCFLPALDYPVISAFIWLHVYLYLFKVGPNFNWPQNIQILSHICVCFAQLLNRLGPGAHWWQFIQLEGKLNICSLKHFAFIPIFVSRVAFLTFSFDVQNSENVTPSDMKKHIFRRGLCLIYMVLSLVCFSTRCAA